MRDKSYYEKRQAEVVDRYASGEEMTLIAEDYGVSDAMIKKIVDSYPGTRHHNERCLSKYGMTLEEFKKVEFISDAMKEQGYTRAQRPLGAYSGHKNRTISRDGVNFTMTFKEWWDCWERSGKWYQRGTKSGQYVMCRKNDEGDYCVGNVYIEKQYHNIRSQKRCSESLPMGVVKKGRSYLAIRWFGKKRYKLGYYKDPSKAGKAFELSLSVPKEKIVSGDLSFLNDV